MRDLGFYPTFASYSRQLGCDWPVSEWLVIGRFWSKPTLAQTVPDSRFVICAAVCMLKGSSVFRVSGAGWIFNASFSIFTHSLSHTHIHCLHPQLRVVRHYHIPAGICSIRQCSQHIPSCSGWSIVSWRCFAYSPFIATAARYCLCDFMWICPLRPFL